MGQDMVAQAFPPARDNASTKPHPRGRLLLSVNTSWNIVNFRASLVRALQARGFEILVATPEDGYEARLSELGCRHIPLNIDNKGTNPLKDIGLFLRYI